MRQFELTGQVRSMVLVPWRSSSAARSLGWIVGGAPTAWSVPEPGRFTMEGGAAATPEFLAVLLGPDLLHRGLHRRGRARRHRLGARMARARRPAALGLTKSQAMRLVILPQALRVIIPPMTSQYLNLTKNSSLAVAIGYPDVVSIANTALNQTGRAVECIAIIMLVYLTTSLVTSALHELVQRARGDQGAVTWP